MTLDTNTLAGATTVRIAVNGFRLDADLEVPPDAKGLVIFAHGSGSSRLSPRNVAVARRLRTHGLGTLLVDLLSEEEDTNYRARFDIDLLTERLAIITDWADHELAEHGLPIGYFAASTGAAAAMRAAAASQDVVRAVVTRGGRVDLAEDVLGSFNVPTLLIVGQNDYSVLEANQEVFLDMPGTKELAIIPRATHLFEEPGALDRVAVLAAEWFNRYLENGTTQNQRGRSGD